MEVEKRTIELSKAESLVLFEFVTRLGAMSDKALNKIIVNPAEKAIIWHLETQLEKSIDELFLPNYDQFLNDAIKEVRSQSGL